MIDRGTPNVVKVTCDRCQQTAAHDVGVLYGGGLRALGYRCEGGTHICPDCVGAETESLADAPVRVPEEGAR